MYSLLFIVDSRSPESLQQNGVWIYQFFYYDQIPNVMKLTKFFKVRHNCIEPYTNPQDFSKNKLAFAFFL